MLEFDGVSAWVEVDDSALTEFEIQVDPKKRTVTCYVISQVGKAFSVHWRWQQPELVSSCHVTIDGQLAAFYHVPESGEYAYVDAIVVENDNGRERRARPTFAPILLTDDEAVGNLDQRIVEATGSIKLNVKRGMEMEEEGSSEESEYDPQDDSDYDGIEELDESEHGTRVQRPGVHDSRPRRSKPWHDGNAPEQPVFKVSGPLDEKWKKAAAHRVIPGKTIAKQKRRTEQGASKRPRRGRARRKQADHTYRRHKPMLFTEDTEFPEVIFVFLYRSEAVLRAHGIIDSPRASVNPKSQSPAQVIARLRGTTEDEEQGRENGDSLESGEALQLGDQERQAGEVIKREDSPLRRQDRGGQARETSVIELLSDDDDAEPSEDENEVQAMRQQLEAIRDHEREEEERYKAKLKAADGQRKQLEAKLAALAKEKQTKKKKRGPDESNGPHAKKPKTERASPSPSQLHAQTGL